MTVCSLCHSAEPKAGCPRCEERQPTLFSLPPPDPEGADTITASELSEQARLKRAEREERLRRLRSLDRPVRIGLVGCSKTKRRFESRARDLYVSPLFKATLAYAEATCDETFVASALYGLVPLDDLIRPYDRALGDLPKKERLAWGERVVEAVALRFPLLPIHLMLFAGLEYTLPIQAAARRRPWLVESPLVRLTIGARLQWLKARMPSPKPVPAARARRRGAS